MACVQSRTLTIADTHEFGQVYLHPEIAIFGFLEIGIHFVVPLFILIWVSARSDQAAPDAKITGWVPGTVLPNAEARGAGSGSKEAEMR